MPDLFTPLKLRGVVLKNRIGMSPMCQHSATDGIADDWHLVHIGSRAVGGAGLVCLEATAVTPDGRISPGDLGLWDEQHVEPLARIARFVEGQGCVPGIQLGHAGRKGSRNKDWVDRGSPLEPENGGWPVVGPSAVPFADGWHVPRQMTKSDLDSVRSAFVAAAERAIRAGFRFLELHAAHGYLSHSFQSPLSNKRTDEYGGSFENRVRFTLELVASVREVWPDDLPLAVRVSATEYHDGGWQLEDTVRLAALLRDAGVDIIDCSSGGSTPHPVIGVGPGYQVPYAEAVRRASAIPTAAVGMITEPAQADEIIRRERADLVLIGRGFLRDPSWAHHAALALGADAARDVPPQYGRMLA